MSALPFPSLPSPLAWQSAIAKAAAESAHPTFDWEDQCLHGVRTFLNIPALYTTARVAYSHIPPEHRFQHTVPPPGHPCFFRTSNSAWHVTLSDVEPWFVWSSDILRVGKFDKVPKSLIQDRWGAAWLGFTLELNGVPIPLAP